ncbi:U6 snRNA phosphodiesterase [Colletotrichum aenigma]|uniref:U6 snRNA phosphodiesterase n=1 Tax=Colletotrichum aenigma TaxID=1215731 RepID=UPI0018733138|nr:U6 snRNA phosphodiesterase [Colletotrichum aenigma]KAF5518703.1 U6 snRNA phosphodiesterase [Colletotrichum aenigma]
MALVDYSSSDSASEPGSPPPKRRKAADGGPEGAVASKHNKTTGASSSASQPAGNSALPPLPEEFHDLYASTVRTSTADDPTLHQGRKRAIPHIVGHWPSHVYIEWHPTASQHALLTNLQAKIAPLLKSQKLQPLLTSDLNAPLPLHVSLTRPLSLTTAQKDDFLSALTSSVSHATGAFILSPRGIGFFKSPDSDRAFLILRVADPRASSRDNNNTTGKNPQLRALLTKCNAVALRFSQQPLYQARATELVDDAFHVSIGWTFGLPPEDACLETYGMLRLPEFAEVKKWEIPVSGVKAKIGNVVTHVPLRDAQKRDGEEDSLFG